MHSPRPQNRFPKLGLGVYTLAETARLCRMPPSTVRAWFRGRSDHQGQGPVFDSDYSSFGDDYALSFLDLIDVLVAGRFRAYGVSMRVIRSSAAALEQDLRTDHPFAHSNLYTDGRRVIAEVRGRIGDQILYDVLSQQMFFTELKNQLERIEYDPASLLARRWHVANGVVIDPAIAFGKPVVRDTGVATAVLARQFVANGRDADLVADLFGLSAEDVRAASEFEVSQGALRAA